MYYKFCSKNRLKTKNGFEIFCLTFCLTIYQVHTLYVLLTKHFYVIFSVKLEIYEELIDKIQKLFKQIIQKLINNRLEI